MYNGITTLGPTLKLTLVTAKGFNTDLTAFITQNDAFNAQRSARQAASDAFQAEIGHVYDWLLGVSNSLATAWGTRWSTQWAQAGFTNYTTAIPAKIEDRLGLVLAIVNFFTANPDYQAPSQNQTVAFGTALRTAALNAQTALAAATATLNSIGDAWNTAYATLLADMKALIKNLQVVLSDSDPRWLNFGLQMPASITTPGQPVNVSAHLDQTGAVIAQCDAVPLALRYRWRTMLVGQQQDYVLGASTTEPIGALGGFLPGQTVQIIVQAANGNLQGVASDPIQFTVPVLIAVNAAQPAAAPAKATEPAHAANGNGNGHSNGNGSAKEHAVRAR